jgi:hypothetical protein
MQPSLTSCVLKGSSSAASLRWLYEQDGDPVGSALADDALDHVATELHRSGLLDVLVNASGQALLAAPHPVVGLPLGI